MSDHSDEQLTEDDFIKAGMRAAERKAGRPVISAAKEAEQKKKQLMALIKRYKKAEPKRAAELIIRISRLIDQYI